MTGRIAALAALLLLAPLAAAAQAPAPTAEEIVARLMEANRQRDQRLAGYQVERRYLLKNELYSKNGLLEVEVAFEAPDRLTFATRAQEGSGMLNKRVFGRMMEGEQESLSPENKRRSAMTPENYDFRLAGEEQVEGRRAYRLEITPRRGDTFLFSRTLLGGAPDFAVG